MELIQVVKRNEIFDGMVKAFQALYPGNQCVIAGGSVRDFYLGIEPKDVDIFFLGLKDWTGDGKKDFKLKLDKSGLEYVISQSNLPWHTYERFLLLTIIYGAIKGAEQKQVEVQFCAFPESTIEGLLSTFDWEICLFAYYDGIIYTTEAAKVLCDKIKGYNKDDKGYKPPAMKLNNVQFPVSNLRRGFKFEYRYPIKLHYPDIIKLCGHAVMECAIKSTQKKKEEKKDES